MHRKSKKWKWSSKKREREQKNNEIASSNVKTYLHLHDTLKVWKILLQPITISSHDKMKIAPSNCYRNKNRINDLIFRKIVCVFAIMESLHVHASMHCCAVVVSRIFSEFPFNFYVRKLCWFGFLSNFVLLFLLLFFCVCVLIWWKG